MEKKKSLHIHTRGSRKTSVALVRLETKGKGEFTVNNKKLSEYFPTQSLQQVFMGALEKAG
ncbi:MAG: 30S ribosomal protein S9, partial [Patescibacteria group bacterium]